MKLCGKATLAASAVAIFFASPALATDLGKTKGDPTSASYELPASWTGVSVSTGLGYTMLNHEISTEDFSFDGISSDGVQVAGIVGYQRQIDALVLGVEGRFTYGDVSTDLVEDDERASLDLDYSYAGYAKVGIARGSWLVSLLAGYKWQHYELTGGHEDTVGGISGGILVETKLSDRWSIGLDALYTRYEDQEFRAFCEDFKLEPSQLEAMVRLTYQLGSF